MSKTRILALVILFPALAWAQIPAPTAKVDVAGEWDLTILTSQGEMLVPTTFVKEGEIYKVSMLGPQGMPMTGEGKLTEAEIEWTVVISTPQGDFALYFKGKIEDDVMTGQAQMGDFGTADFRGPKKK